MSRRRYARVWWAALLLWACAILWLSSLTPDELPRAAFVLWDKVNHVAAFALGGWLAARALHTSTPTLRNTRVVALAVLLIAAFGVLDEAVQAFTPGRTGADLYDWIADVLGAITGALLSLSAHRLGFRRTSKERR